MNMTAGGMSQESENTDARGNSQRREFLLQNLCCANCAGKIENQVKGIPEIKTAYLDFLSKKLVVQLKDEEKLDCVVNKIKDIVSTIEPEVKVLYGGEINELEKNEDSRELGNRRAENIVLGIGVLLYAIAIIFNFQLKVEIALYLISYFIIGKEVLLKAFKNIIKGHVFDENFLMCVATIGALSIRQFPEAVAVMLFYKIGEYFEDKAVDHSRRSISDLMNTKSRSFR